jgi:hypothetical protein
VIRLMLAIGHVQAWLAQGYREGTAIERALIFPSWAVFRGLFIALLTVVEARHGTGG